MTTEVTAPSEVAVMRILMLDDDEVDRRAVRRALLKSGVPATVDEAASAAELMQRLPLGAHDCVLLDYHMPGVDSLALLRQARHLAPELPVVMLTGRGDEELAVELMKSGAADYLSKSGLTPERLISSIRHAIELSREAAARRRAEEELRESEAKLRRISESGIVGVFHWVAGGTVIEANDEFCRMFGWSQEEVNTGRVNLRTQTPADWRDIDRVNQEELYAHGKVTNWEKEFYASDGRRVPVILGAVLLEGSTDRGVAVCLDITQRKEAERERERLLSLEHASRTRAERATKMRDEILAVVAHDLRDPVHTITMAASTMLEMPASRQESVRQLEVMRRAAKRMDRLIGDLLDVSRMESGQFAIRPAPVEIRALVEEALESFDLQAAPRGLTLAAECAPDVPLVSGDRDRLAQVLSNLVGNALKFTPAGGRIRLRAARVDDFVQVSVEDSGAGIPDDELPHIFDRFWQAERTSRSGAGLGLAIAKGIIDAHGGRIWAESTVGHGTSVHFTVPCASDRDDDA